MSQHGWPSEKAHFESFTAGGVNTALGTEDAEFEPSPLHR